VTTGANNIEIGNLGTSRDDNVIRLGDPAVQRKTFVAGISGATVANGVAVMVNSKGQLGVATSSARYKEDIQPMDRTSETLFSLKPVTFRYKKDADPSQALSFGLIAEEVAQVSPELITRDEEGKPQTVRYEAVNAMLLNEFLKEHRMVQEQGAMIAEFQKEIGVLKAGLQRVSAQVEISRPRPQMASNKTD
jgi:hypothetical protein